VDARSLAPCPSVTAWSQRDNTGRCAPAYVDYGSGTDLASVTADVAAAREVRHLLAPLITPHAPYLVGTAGAQLRTLDAEAIATQEEGGHWVAVTALPTGDRERIDAAAGAALETLARVPDLLALGGT
jgi:hypothetical protein